MEWPKCEECKGTRAVDVGGYKSINRCPVCNGTGERELTADEAAEYMDANGQHGIGPIYFPGATQPGQKYGIGLQGELVFEETIKEIFNKAARAAYRRQG